jgi:hypothetical protein
VKKLLIVLAMLIAIPVFAVNIPECFKDHQPPIDWPDTYPKGMAGCTLFYPLTTDPGPEYFGWDDEEEDFIAMCAIVSTYESWYAAQMGEIADTMEDFEEPMNVYERDWKANALAGLIYDIDTRFMEDGDECWKLIPPTVQANYIYYMENL